ncbi:MAG TPA: 5-oxoprolinase subunit PxpB [Candidatus Limnocylindrales bacterium]|nr:5-oxoprolinase subunit PxpB [Candidatus Limnocylindrales bacterium]
MGSADAGANGRIAAVGDAAVLLTLAERVDPELSRRAQAIAAAIDAARAEQPGLGRAVPAHASVLIPFDPLAIEIEVVTTLVGACAGRTGLGGVELEAPAPVEIPVRYGGVDGPDLADVAAIHGLRPSEIVELHAGAVYRVLFLGFAPGFAYLGGLPPGLVTPRRATPRARVPAGSVGIAGEQTGVYPLAMPGGWQLIGRTDAPLWDTARPSPALLGPGDRVRFVPVR